MHPARLCLIMILNFSACNVVAQTDSIRTAAAKADSLIELLRNLPKKYLTTVDNKIGRYTRRVSSKTEKTLTRLARWEAKIKSLLEKASPETALRLFGNNQITFAAALEKYKQGEAIYAEQRAKYNQYRDKLSTSIHYLESQKAQLDKKLVEPLEAANTRLEAYEKQQDRADALEEFIKERKKLLIGQSLQYIGKSKYLQKINKDAYYYFETIRNYKEIFSDKEKAEETALTILNKIPAFQKFVQQNSMLARLFNTPGSTAAGSQPILSGLQTRASINALIQNQLAAGGPNAADQIRSNIREAQSQFNQLKEKALKGGGANGEADLPDFTPNHARTQVFKQRLEKGFSLQFGKNNSLVPTTADIGLHLGYRLNDKSVIGIGAAYKMGLGAIQRISISHQGLGLRSYLDWKLKKQFFISGGFEANYNAVFRSITQLQQYNSWQQSGLIGLSKKIMIKTKYFKSTKFQILYDLLATRNIPLSQPVLFRMGYNF